MRKNGRGGYGAFVGCCKGPEAWPYGQEGKASCKHGHMGRQAAGRQGLVAGGGSRQATCKHGHIGRWLAIAVQNTCLASMAMWTFGWPSHCRKLVDIWLDIALLNNRIAHALQVSNHHSCIAVTACLSMLPGSNRRYHGCEVQPPGHCGHYSSQVRRALHAPLHCFWCMAVACLLNLPVAMCVYMCNVSMYANVCMCVCVSVCMFLEVSLHACMCAGCVQGGDGCVHGCGCAFVGVQALAAMCACM